jgi:hypothetical protein
LKLKRDIGYGDRIDKQTVMAVRFRANIDTGHKWKGSIPLRIPQLETAPTALNAALVSSRYYVAIHAQVLGAKTFIIELPFVVSLFPPFTLPLPAQPGPIPRSEQEMLHEYPLFQPEILPPSVPKTEGEPIPPPVIQSSTTNLQSLAPQFLEIDNAIEQLKSCLADIESAIVYAQSNQLTDVFEGESSYLLSQKELVQKAEVVIQDEKQFFNIASNCTLNPDSFSSLGQNAIGFAEHVSIGNDSLSKFVLLRPEYLATIQNLLPLSSLIPFSRLAS